MFRRRRFLSGAAASALAWYTPAGTPMTSADWADPNARCLTIHLDGTSDPDRAEDGTPEVDDDFLVLVNGWWEPLTFTVPDLDGSRPWQRELDSYDPAAADGRRRWRPAAHSPSARVRSSSCAAPAEPDRGGRLGSAAAAPTPDTVHVRESRTCGRAGHERSEVRRRSRLDAQDRRRADLKRGAGGGGLRCLRCRGPGPTMRWRNV